MSDHEPRPARSGPPAPAGSDARDDAGRYLDHLAAVVTRPDAFFAQDHRSHRVHALIDLGAFLVQFGQAMGATVDDGKGVGAADRAPAHVQAQGVKPWHQRLQGADGVPNRFQREREVFVLDMESCGLAYKRSPRNWALAKTGDTDKRQILMEATLEARNEAASGIIADLTTS